LLKRIQSLLQRLFLAAEAVGNRIFGDRLNPLYYLGATSYWMFWLVVASGLYLYAFYETGIDKTYASMESITHGQWFAGGILRSVHRYASDAMVLTMMLHMLRHFSFDRYRSFRAFSWVSGIVVMWLIYVSGVNGFMLPWDKLSQFVIVATTEWLDALPVFNGILTRNFITPEAVTDRLFSLLSFLHIGIPLVALLSLWVHTQRVPRASQIPPRPLAIGLALMLLVISIAVPVVSQAPADLGTVPITLKFDWFYLVAYPLIYSWDPIKLWVLVGGVTLLLMAPPWLPPVRAGKEAVYELTAHPGRQQAPVRAGETLLDAGLRADIPLPYECRSGGCGVFETMKPGDELSIEGPVGSFVLHEPSEKPLIFVAGATGFAPVKSLLEQAFRMGIERPMYFYWGVRRPRDLYLLDLPRQWEREHPNFHFVPVASEPLPEDDWQGRTGFVHEAILADFPDLRGFSVYACGSVRMVQAARPAFVAQGLHEDACYSDAFTPQSTITPAG